MTVRLFAVVLCGVKKVGLACKAVGSEERRVREVNLESVLADAMDDRR